MEEQRRKFGRSARAAKQEGPTFVAGRFYDELRHVGL